MPGSSSVASDSVDTQAAGELAFWNSIQASNRADEYRAYLRQYPSGRFAALAQTRLAAIDTPPAAVARPSTDAALAARPELLPRVGDTWRYRVQDQFRLGDLYVTAKVDQVSADGVAETWTTTADAKLRTTLASLAPGFNALPGWTLTPPEFAPYLLASGPLRAGQALAAQQRRVDEVNVPLRVTIDGEEDVAVAAGRFRATKLTLRGQAKNRGGATVLAEQTVWYAPQARRIVKTTVSTRVGASLRESTTFELMEFRLN